MVFLALFILALSILSILVISKRINLLPSSENQISESTLLLISNIKNEDVIWSGTVIGLIPKLTGATLELKDTEENINPLLVDILLDENKFVAAHVLLTLRTSGPYPIGAAEWNGLKIQLQSNGKATFEGNNLIELQKYWKERLRR